MYAERGERHHLPHCHGYSSDGESVVSPRDGELLSGDDLPAVARRLIGAHLDEIRRAWDSLNPEDAPR